MLTTSLSSRVSAPLKVFTKPTKAWTKPFHVRLLMRITPTWCGAKPGTPDLEFARKFAEAVHKVHPGKLLAYNCSPSFNWKKNLDDATIAKFQRELGAMGYKYQFITLAGIHSMWFNMFDLAQDYAARGMSAYVEKVQEPEFAARDRGYSFVFSPTRSGHRLL
jgi:isocitrate lyase